MTRLNWTRSSQETNLAPPVRRLPLVMLGILGLAVSGCGQEFVGYWNDTSVQYTDGVFSSALYNSADITLVDEETQAYEFIGFWAYTTDESEWDDEPKTWLTRGRWSGGGVIDDDGRLPITGSLEDCSGSPISTVASAYPLSYSPPICVPGLWCDEERLYGRFSFESDELEIEDHSLYDWGRNDDRDKDLDFC